MLLIVFLVVSVLFTAAALFFGGLCTGAIAILYALGLFVGCYLALVILFGLVFLISALLIDTSKPRDHYSAYHGFMVDQFLSLAIFFGRVHIHATGLEKVPKEPFLLVSNHQYNFDPLCFMHVMPQARLGFIYKQELDTWPIVKKYLPKLRCLPIDRENDRAALRTIIQTVKILQEGKQSYGVFPEGYVSWNDELMPFRNGVFKVAQKANVPILVCTLRNTKAILKNLFLRRTDVELHVLELIPAEEIRGMSTRDVGDRVHKLMEDDLA